MNAPTPEPAPAFVAWRRIAVVVVAVWSVSLAWRSVGPFADAVRAMGRGRGGAIERTSGLSPALLESLRTNLRAGDRLVLYSPYGGQQYELDGADPRGEPARQVRFLFERTKNLLYPDPRDVHFARDDEELLGKLAGRAPGSVLVLDGTLAAAPLAVGGEHELLFEHAPGKPRLRLWRWRGNA